MIFVKLYLAIACLITLFFLIVLKRFIFETDDLMNDVRSLKEDINREYGVNFDDEATFDVLSIIFGLIWPYVIIDVFRCSIKGG